MSSCLDATVIMNLSLLVNCIMWKNPQGYDNIANSASVYIYILLLLLLNCWKQVWSCKYDAAVIYCQIVQYGRWLIVNVTKVTKNKWKQCLLTYSIPCLTDNHLNQCFSFCSSSAHRCQKIRTHQFNGLNASLVSKCCCSSIYHSASSNQSVGHTWKSKVCDYFTETAVYIFKFIMRISLFSLKKKLTDHKPLNVNGCIHHNRGLKIYKLKMLVLFLFNGSMSPPALILINRLPFRWKYFWEWIVLALK